MTTLRQIAPNRRNAERRTGPRTEGGKRRSRRSGQTRWGTRSIEDGDCVSAPKHFLDEVRPEDAGDRGPAYASAWLRIASAAASVGPHRRAAHRSARSRPPPPQEQDAAALGGQLGGRLLGLDLGDRLPTPTVARSCESQRVSVTWSSLALRGGSS